MAEGEARTASLVLTMRDGDSVYLHRDGGVLCRVLFRRDPAGRTWLKLLPGPGVAASRELFRARHGDEAEVTEGGARLAVVGFDRRPPFNKPRVRVTAPVSVGVSRRDPSAFPPGAA